MTPAKPWMYLEQARIWIMKSVESTDDRKPCHHCLTEARGYLDLAEGIGIQPEAVA